MLLCQLEILPRGNSMHHIPSFQDNAPFRKISNSAQSGRFALILWRGLSFVFSRLDCHLITQFKHIGLKLTMYCYRWSWLTVVEWSIIDWSIYICNHYIISPLQMERSTAGDTMATVSWETVDHHRVLFQFSYPPTYKASVWLRWPAAATTRWLLL